MKKHQDQLPPELQDLVKQEMIKAGEASTTAMHRQVTVLGKARKELEEAHAARLNLHASWRSFLTDQVQKWQSYATNFQQQEKLLAERVLIARQALDNAKSDLVASKKSLGEASGAGEDTMTISDEEPDPKESTDAGAQKISDGLQHLTASLESLQNQADLAVQAEQQSLKRPRLNGPASTGEQNASQDAEVHFGSAGHA